MPTREERLEAELEASAGEVASLSARVHAGASAAAGLRKELAAAHRTIARHGAVQQQLADTLRHEQDQREALCDSLRASQLDGGQERDLAARERAQDAREQTRERRRLQRALEDARKEAVAERGAAKEKVAELHGAAAKNKSAHAKELQVARAELTAAAGRVRRLRKREGVVRERVVACEAQLTRLRGCKQEVKVQTAAATDTRRELAALRTDHERQIRDKDALVEGLKSEVDAAHDRFQQSVLSVELNMARQLNKSKLMSTKLKARCDYLARKVRSQDAILHTLDCSIDRMIAADPLK